MSTKTEDVAAVVAERDALAKVVDRVDRVLELAAVALERGAPDVRTLDERISSVQLELEDVPRRGHADVQTKSGGSYSYDYITEADLMKAVRPLLAKNGVATYYSDEIIENGNGSARVRVSLTLSANGEERVLVGEGFATDYGDKAPSKAKTTAVRYLLWKTFLQPSDEDPEQENVAADDAARASARRDRSTSKATPASRGRLVERIGHLALELDEIQGRSAGATLASLPGLARDTFELSEAYPNGASDAELVSIGKQLAEFVANERARKEADPDSYAPAELELRR